MNIKRFINSCFGLGWLPIAPGTWGSLPPPVIFVLLKTIGNVGFVGTTAVMIFIALIASVSCVRFAGASIEALDQPDPREIVLDELAGSAIAFTGAFGMPPQSAILTASAGFLLFRFFDIVKIRPCRKLEKLPRGWGILADDLMAGLYAAVALQLCIRCGII
ncbi:MAG: phosphatidylglycerophosphatase A [Planctomycetota bacterium]